ncbi:MAG: Hsp20/alpha crystallin family protein [Candidatus Pacebacteria bacterium]|nr:Hsp20/alpha crystallin family protein [Candidatus Paceibacterota bacterium]MCF7857583.1 Hsp20/alpha crystallin family protein [Candidatus Paceibacterota bacterium]
MIKKPSFLERITGSIKLDSSKTDDFDETEVFIDTENTEDQHRHDQDPNWQQPEEDDQDGELPIDMYQTRDTIVIRALVAGVSPDDLNISITRDMVTLKGQREEVQEVPDEDYYHRELFWGSFSRSILLPEEIVIDEAEARERHGYLEIILPKLDKGRSAKLTVKSHHSTK